LSQLVPSVTKITAKAPETSLPEWTVDQIKQAFPVCLHLPPSTAKALLLPLGLVVLQKLLW